MLESLEIQIGKRCIYEYREERWGDPLGSWEGTKVVFCIKKYSILSDFSSDISRVGLKVQCPGGVSTLKKWSSLVAAVTPRSHFLIDDGEVAHYRSNFI